MLAMQNNQTNNNQNHHSQHFSLGRWQVDPDTRQIQSGKDTERLEPKVMELLLLLVSKPHTVFSKADIMTSLWPNVVVNEHTLARTISRLRRALQDPPAESRYIETIPKKGYRIIADYAEILPEKEPAQSHKKSITIALSAVLLLAIAATIVIQPFPDKERQLAQSQAQQLTARADNLYMQFTREGNESAIALYEKAIAQNPDYALAQSGLANALVQRVVRWHDLDTYIPADQVTLESALAQGLTSTAQAKAILRRASEMAQRAERLSPNEPAVLKAMGLTYSAQGDFDKAQERFKQAVNLEPNAWDSLINLAEINKIKGDDDNALRLFEQAYRAMDNSYQEQPHKVEPWQAELGVLIAQEYQAKSHLDEAELWYRQVLNIAPYHQAATTELADILIAAGEVEEAHNLCLKLSTHLGNDIRC
jgi:DNA-binding winged helix-turn-helix (wHTH) protein